jgi:pantothenate kinase
MSYSNFFDFFPNSSVALIQSRHQDDAQLLFQNMYNSMEDFDAYIDANMGSALPVKIVESLSEIERRSNMANKNTPGCLSSSKVIVVPTRILNYHDKASTLVIQSPSTPTSIVHVEYLDSQINNYSVGSSKIASCEVVFQSALGSHSIGSLRSNDIGRSGIGAFCQVRYVILNIMSVKDFESV